MGVWLIGLSGVGQTVIGQTFSTCRKPKVAKPGLVDGDKSGFGRIVIRVFMEYLSCDRPVQRLTSFAATEIQ